MDRRPRLSGRRRGRRPPAGVVPQRKGQNELREGREEPPSPSHSFFLSFLRVSPVSLLQMVAASTLGAALGVSVQLYANAVSFWGGVVGGRTESGGVVRRSPPPPFANARPARLARAGGRAAPLDVEDIACSTHALAGVIVWRVPRPSRTPQNSHSTHRALSLSGPQAPGPPPALAPRRLGRRGRGLRHRPRCLDGRDGGGGGRGGAQAGGRAPVKQESNLLHSLLLSAPL